MPVREVSSRDGDGKGPLTGLQVIVGLFAGLAAVIYLTGGVALGLRLLWSGLPTLSVAQLPREFLFSIGAAQVVVPSLAVGLVAGFAELGQTLGGLKEGHRRWSYAKQTPALRRLYVVFYGTIPFVLISPGIGIAIGTDDDIEDEWLLLPALGVSAAVLLGVWVYYQRKGSLGERGGPLAEERPNLRPREWAVILGPGFVLSLVFGVWICWQTDAGPRYFAILGAWAVAVFFALLTVWLRSRVGEKAREHLSAHGANTDVPPWLVVVSWCATALLAVPAFVAVTAAAPLPGAVACAQQVEDRPYVAAGRFVGETKDRVYIGEDANGVLISVPAGNVSRLLVGRETADPTACSRSRDPGPR